MSKRGRKSMFTVTNQIIYRTWNSMRQRCYNPNHSSSKYYYFKNIGICDEWLTNYESFENWALTNGWELGLEIDRIDNNAGYSPGNCRWVTELEQQNNTSYNHPITINIDGVDVTKNLKQWAKQYEVDYTTILSRLNTGKTGLDLIKKTNYKPRG